MTATAVHLPTFRNEHLSVSRLKRFEECPLAFYFQYVNRPEGYERAFAEPAEFGTVLHDALERTYRWIVDEEYEGPFPEAQALEFFRHAWSVSGLTGVALYQEGRELLRAYAREVGLVDHMRTLAVEREFNLLLGPGVCRLVDATEKPKWQLVEDHFVVNGFIDRVDRVDAETVEVIDYKSGRLLFTRDELAGDLQMSIYALVAREMYPWARRVRMNFHMLRHGIAQATDRSEDDLQAVREYVLSLGTRTERGPYDPKINTHCATCDHRVRCDAYRVALTRKLEVVKVSTDDMAALAIERERVAKIAKAAYARKEELDGVLKAAIARAGTETLELGGFVFRLLQYFNTEYPPEGVRALFDEVGVDCSSVIRIDNEAVEALLVKAEKDESIPHHLRDFLRVRLAAKAVKIPQKARIDARPKKKT